MSQQQLQPPVIDAGRRRLGIALSLNLLLVVFELIGFRLSFARNGFGLLQYYTEDSNLLALVVCALSAVYQFRCLRTGRALPSFVGTLKYIAVCCLTVTFLVVVFVLSPSVSAAGQPGFRLMLLTDSMLYMHLLCPVLAFVSFVFFDTLTLPAGRAVRIALIPTVIYAIISTALNIARVLYGPYPFLHVYEQPVWLSCVWIAVIVGGAGLIAWLLWRWNDRVTKRRAA